MPVRTRSADKQRKQYRANGTFHDGKFLQRRSDIKSTQHARTPNLFAYKHVISHTYSTGVSTRQSVRAARLPDRLG